MLLCFTVTPQARAQNPAPQVLSFDVLIQAGHEGRPESCARFPQHQCNLGAADERAYNAIVANEATRVLRAHGVSVARVPADFPDRYDVKAAAFVHFDGTEKPCTSGASVGYRSSRLGAPASTDVRAAQLWHQIYGKYFPFRWMADDFTTNLSRYYGFRQVRAKNGALVLEFGELTCPAQRAWLEPRLHWDGALLAYFLSRLAGVGNIPEPGA